MKEKRKKWCESSVTWHVCLSSYIFNQLVSLPHPLCVTDIPLYFYINGCLPVNQYQNEVQCLLYATLIRELTLFSVPRYITWQTNDRTRSFDLCSATVNATQPS